MSSNQPNVPPWFWGQPTQPPPGSTGVAGNQTYPGQQAQDTLTTFWNWVWQHPGQNFQQTQAGAGRGTFPPQSPFSSDRSTSYRGYSPNAGMDNESAMPQNSFMGAAGNMASGIANNTRFPPQGGVVPQNVGAGGVTAQTAQTAPGQTYPSGGGHGPELGRAHPGMTTPGKPGGGQGQGQGTTPNGMSPDELKWKGMADQVGLNWDVVKNVYMNPNRSGSADPAYALERALKDKAWGDAAIRFGILRQGGTPENDAWNNQVWIDHYNAGKNIEFDPMVGHNEAIADWEANYQNFKSQLQGPVEYPDWYTPPPQ